MEIIHWLSNNHLIFLAFSGVLGLIMGSFLNVVIYRLPIILKNEYEKSCHECFNKNITTANKIINLAYPSSHCTHCHTQILWWQNIPLLSYLFLGGKCYFCKTHISLRYPCVELLSCIATILVAMHFGVQAKTVFMMVITWALISAIFIDLEHKLIPDIITIPLLWLGLIINTNNVFATPEQAIIGATAGYLALWLVAKIFKMVRKIDGMGHGDFKLLAVFGAWLGWQILPAILLSASLAGSIMGIILIIFKRLKFAQPLPFGPYLALFGWLAFFFGQKTLNWYSNFFLGI